MPDPITVERISYEWPQPTPSDNGSKTLFGVGTAAMGMRITVPRENCCLQLKTIIISPRPYVLFQRQPEMLIWCLLPFRTLSRRPSTSRSAPYVLTTSATDSPACSTRMRLPPLSCPSPRAPGERNSHMPMPSHLRSRNTTFNILPGISMTAAPSP